MFFATVELIAQQGINKWRYRETAQLSEIAFQFQEKQNPMGYVSMLSSKDAALSDPGSAACQLCDE